MLVLVEGMAADHSTPANLGSRLGKKTLRAARLRARTSGVIGVAPTA